MPKIDPTEIATLDRYLRTGTDPAAIRHTLDLLWSDVVGAADIPEAHPRFMQHLGLMAWASRWDDLQARMDACSWDGFAEANAIARATIRRTIEQVLHQM